MNDAIRAANIVVSAALKFLSSCSEEDIVELAAKRTAIIISFAQSGQEKSKKKSKGTSSFKEILALLEKAPDRETGFNELLAKVPNKDGLLRLAKYLDIPATAKMSIDKISNSIVESTTGSRIRSRAIQG